MKAIDYFKEKARMTDDCVMFCKICPLSSANNGTRQGCETFQSNHPKKAVEIVEKWAKENPPKTYKDVLLEKLPNVKIDKGGFPRICVSELFNTEKYCNDVSINCRDCWNREYKEEE